MANSADGLKIAANLFKIDALIFIEALAIDSDQLPSREIKERVERLREAMLELRHTIPEVHFATWAQEPLPRLRNRSCWTQKMREPTKQYCLVCDRKVQMKTEPPSGGARAIRDDCYR
jgi:hypothetical protein